MKISEASIAEVRTKADLVAVVSEHVALKRSGSGMKGLCPFHDEKTPSFTINPGTNTWRCFGCGMGGDVIEFRSQIQGEGFRWAVESLADQFHVTLDTTQADAADHTAHQSRTRLHDVNEAASEFFGHLLRDDPEAEVARAELLARGFTVAAAVDQFDCGYCPQSGRTLIQHLRGKGFTDQEMTDAGLTFASERAGLLPRFRQRLTWTIRNSFGRAVGFGARRITEDDPLDAKFINTTETAVYKKSTVLYGFDRARAHIARARRAIVVEGYTDVMAAHTAESHIAVAACGTAFTPEHLAVLRRIVGEDGEITFALDDDEAGKTATMRIYSLAQGSVRKLTALPPSAGMDPDKYRQEHGDEALASLLEQRRPLLEVVIRSTLSSMPQDTPEERLLALDKVAEYLGHIQEPLILRDYAQKVGTVLGYPAAEVLNRTPGNGTPPTTDEPAPLPSQPLTEGWVEREVLRVLIQHEDIARDLLDHARWLFNYPISSTITAALDTAMSRSTANAWPHRVADAAADEAVASTIHALAAAPLPVPVERAAEYAAELVDRLQDEDVARHQQALIQQLRETRDEEERTRLVAMLTQVGQG